MEFQSDKTEQLMKLLACKRHEQPPPGYFTNFAVKVIARIEAQEMAQQSSWWQRLVAHFDAKPVLACSYGLAIGAVLLFGVSLASVFEEQQTAAIGVGEGLVRPGPYAASFGTDAPPPVRHDLAQPGMASALATSLDSSVNPVVLGPPSFLLGNGSAGRVERAGWSGGGK
ncbi:MAG: hypothetical protein HYY24_26545 [Verrucomicrobia bacterium]|nr:hypothetical protein [Verrucomicrobiota bacterium]